MKVPFLALLSCAAFMGVGLLIGDYIELHEQVRYVDAEQKAERALQQPQNPDSSRNGPNPVSEGYVEHGRHEEPKWTDIALAALTFALAFFTMALYMDAREKGRKELRAYLGLNDQVIKRLPTGLFQLSITIGNSGKTPAHDVRVTLEVGPGNENAPDQGWKLGTLTGRMPLAPNAERSIRQVLWSLEQADVPRIALQNSDRVIFAWGRIEYRDIYDARQHVDFRFVTREQIVEHVMAGDRIIDERIAGWALQPTEDGNDAS
jgi:hypothetical protein